MIIILILLRNAILSRPQFADAMDRGSLRTSLPAWVTVTRTRRADRHGGSISIMMIRVHWHILHIDFWFRDFAYFAYYIAYFAYSWLAKNTDSHKKAHILHIILHIPTLHISLHIFLHIFIWNPVHLVYHDGGTYRDRNVTVVRTGMYSSIVHTLLGQDIEGIEGNVSD